MSTTPATLKTVEPAHSEKAHNNLTPSRPPTLLFVPSRSYQSTPSTSSRLEPWAGSSSPASSLTSKPWKEVVLMDKACSVDAFPCGVRRGDLVSYRRANPYPPRGTRHGINERGVPSILSRCRHQAGVCLPEHPSADRSERACGPDDFVHRALFSRRLDTSELPLDGADEDDRLPEQPDSSLSFANRDAVQGALRQGCLSRPSPGDPVPGARAQRGPHK